MNEMNAAVHSNAEQEWQHNNVGEVEWDIEQHRLRPGECRCQHDRDQDEGAESELLGKK